MDLIQKPEKLWQNLCSSVILGKNILMKQIGFRIGNSSYCYACTFICRENKDVKQKIVDNDIYCMCHEQKDKKCLFSQGIELENKKKFPIITDMIREHCHEMTILEKNKIKEFEAGLQNRNFDFEKS